MKQALPYVRCVGEVSCFPLTKRGEVESEGCGNSGCLSWAIRRVISAHRDFVLFHKNLLLFRYRTPGYLQWTVREVSSAQRFSSFVTRKYVERFVTQALGLNLNPAVTPVSLVSVALDFFHFSFCFSSGAVWYRGLYAVHSSQSWPLTLDRAHYESEALLAAFKTCPNLCPEVYHADRTMATIVMRYIGEKYLVFRKGVALGYSYPGKMEKVAV